MAELAGISQSSVETLEYQKQLLGLVCSHEHTYPGSNNRNGLVRGSIRIAGNRGTKGLA